MVTPQVRVLILACGNTLRSDDGVGPWLANWAEQHFAAQPEIRVISRQQWTPELAEDIAYAAIDISPTHPSKTQQGLATHHSGAPELLALVRDLYDSFPSNAQIITIGLGSTELGKQFSEPVLNSLPHACRLIKQTMTGLLAESPR